jgi:hypothetical protein
MVHMFYVLGLSHYKIRKHWLEGEWYVCFSCLFWERDQSDAFVGVKIDAQIVTIHVELSIASWHIMAWERPDLR